MPNETAAPEKVTTLAALRQSDPPEARMPQVRSGMGDLQGFELMQRVAKALAASTLVPQQFQNNLPNCLVALEMAQRLGASPLMICQNLFVVHGRPGWSAKFLVASFNQCGRFSAIRFEWSGTRDTDSWSCKAWATEKSTGEKITGPSISIGLAKKEGWYEKNGSKWKTIPELMLMYRAAAWMVNTHAPEISMGLNTAEELNDVFDATRSPDGGYHVSSDELRQPGSDTAVGPGDPEQPITKERIVAMIAAATSVEAIDLAMDTAAELPETEILELAKKAADARSKLQTEPEKKGKK